MDTAKTLFQSIGIPRQVVVYHQMRALKVDAFASSIRSDQDAHANILLEELFCFSPFITEHSAVDGNNSIVISEQSANLSGKVVERVLVFREDDQFFTPSGMETATMSANASAVSVSVGPSRCAMSELTLCP